MAEFLYVTKNGKVIDLNKTSTNLSDFNNDVGFITLDDVPDPGETYTAGAGIKIEDGVIAVETRVIDISQEDYDKLTETQKKDPSIYYCIVDSIGSGGTSLPFRLGIDENGNYGYYKVGADTVTPFKTGGGNNYGVYISKEPDIVDKTWNDFIATTYDDIKAIYSEDYIITSEIIKIEEEE